MDESYYYLVITHNNISAWKKTLYYMHDSFHNKLLKILQHP
jgi:hypothetical protein